MMEFIFFNQAGETLFTRLDMESGHWVQQEMSVNADFPFRDDKRIEFGQRIAFRDPATNNLEVFEIHNVANTAVDGYQQITAEHIVIAELSDEHLNNLEITNKTAGQVLTTILSGTGWEVGTNTSDALQSLDISRGSVWNAVNAIQSNWNVYITPRVTVNSAGAITHKYLDIAPAVGTFRGMRLSIRKNFLDPTVTYDDSEVFTALYGYGGSVTVPHTGADDTQEELTFANVVWLGDLTHPAKPAGQTYVEWPQKTAIYGRNGRPRFGYYQNANIKDPYVLCEKTWAMLQTVSEPKISITGTCADLYRLGYNDEPLRLHDIITVEIEETREVFRKEIIMLDVDLVDPTGSRPEIGDYIPNIVYINRDTEETASGGGGGGGGHGQPKSEYDDVETKTEFVRNNELIGMVVYSRGGDKFIKAGQIVLAINQSGETGQYESSAYINADHVNISGTSTVYTLAGDLEHDANGRLVIKNAGGVYVERTEQGTTAYFGVWDRGNLTGGVMVQQINGQTAVKISGDVIDINSSHLVINAEHIDINGLINALKTRHVYAQSLTVDGGEIDADNINCELIDCTGINTNDGTITCGIINAGGSSLTCGTVNCGAVNATGYTITSGSLDTGTIDCTAIDCTSINTNDGSVSCGNISCGTINTGGKKIQCGAIEAPNHRVTCGSVVASGDITSSGTVSGATGSFTALSVNGSAATWKSQTVVTGIVTPTLTTTTLKTYTAKDGTEQQGRLVTGWAQGSFTTATLNYLGA